MIARWTILLIFVADVASFFASFNPIATSALAVVIAVVAFALSIVRLDLALLVVIAELVHGSLGHLFEIHLPGGHEIPLRMLLFGAVMLGWLICIAFRRYHFFVDRQKSVTCIFAVLLGVAGYGAAVGMARGNPLSAIISDGNAYAYLLLLLPLRSVMRRFPDFKKRALAVVVASAAMTAMLTLAIHLLYRADLSALRDVYVWIRDWGLGQVTPPDHAAFNRIFFQSHVWVLLAMLLTTNPLVAGVMLSVIFLSFSRSLWLGAIATIPFFPVRYLKSAVVAAIIVLLIAPAAVGLAGERSNITTEPAAASRWSLLPVLWSAIEEHPIVGHGFGSTLTYETKDPKLIAEYGTSQFTTYSFEWGYLEQWFKMGIFGLAALLALLTALGLKIWRFKGDLRQGLLVGLLALAVVHIASPYLNHPLGLGFLLLADLFTEPGKGEVSMTA